MEKEKGKRREEIENKEWKRKSKKKEEINYNRKKRDVIARNA